MIHSPTPPRAGRRLVAAVGALSLASASVLLAGAAPAMAVGPICGTFERAAVSGDNYVVQNNAWGDTPGQCVTPRDGGFTITKAEGDLEFGGAPKSYPSIFAGEHYGEGSNTASLPVKVSEIGSARTSARITEADGAYNAAWDIWANSSPDSPDAERRHRDHGVGLHQGRPQPDRDQGRHRHLREPPLRTCGRARAREALMWSPTSISEEDHHPGHPPGAVREGLHRPRGHQPRLVHHQRAVRVRAVEGREGPGRGRLHLLPHRRAPGHHHPGAAGRPGAAAREGRRRRRRRSG